MVEFRLGKIRLGLGDTVQERHDWTVADGRVEGVLSKLVESL
jgi:hypothetical protein